ncbi:CchlQ [Streptomyces sp. ICBB 8177]|uniref:CchlQ n=1 Tax=Streptomyces sp. ICBB 8177 TaxID=563922 RepID=UPI000D68266C|nr:CchlQ [Streptomyces sp. ICBB 8177]PWI44785.1 CchlQ [Streptomyces sp. ICBB 8177]
MEWGTLVATLGGAVIAMSGTLLADRLRARKEDDRGLGSRRREVYLEFIAATGVAHARLRELAQSAVSTTAGLDGASRDALAEAGVHQVRERLFIDASAPVAAAGQRMFERLRALRAAVAAGATLSSRAFHDAYHPYIDAVWAYRVAVREELEGRPLVPAVFGWSTWDGTERCALCEDTADG